MSKQPSGVIISGTIIFSGELGYNLKGAVREFTLRGYQVFQLGKLKRLLMFGDDFLEVRKPLDASSGDEAEETLEAFTFEVEQIARLFGATADDIGECGDEPPFWDLFGELASADDAEIAREIERRRQIEI